MCGFNFTRNLASVAASAGAKNMRRLRPRLERYLSSRYAHALIILRARPDLAQSRGRWRPSLAFVLLCVEGLRFPAVVRALTVDWRCSTGRFPLAAARKRPPLPWFYLLRRVVVARAPVAPSTTGLLCRGKMPFRAPERWCGGRRLFVLVTHRDPMLHVLRHGIAVSDLDLGSKSLSQVFLLRLKTTVGLMVRHYAV